MARRRCPVKQFHTPGSAQSVHLNNQNPPINRVPVSKFILNRTSCRNSPSNRVLCRNCRNSRINHASDRNSPINHCHVSKFTHQRMPCVEIHPLTIIYTDTFYVLCVKILSLFWFIIYPLTILHTFTSTLSLYRVLKPTHYPYCVLKPTHYPYNLSKSAFYQNTLNPAFKNKWKCRFVISCCAKIKDCFQI